MSRRARKSQAETNDAAKKKSTTKADVAAESADTASANPPRTTTGGWFTAPKFGSAGAGGAELEPGPERD